MKKLGVSQGPYLMGRLLISVLGLGLLTWHLTFDDSGCCCCCCWREKAWLEGEGGRGPEGRVGPLPLPGPE